MKKVSAFLFVMALITAPLALSAQEHTIAGKVEFGVGSIAAFQYYTTSGENGPKKDYAWGIGGITTASSIPTPVNVGFFPIDNLSIGGSILYTSYKDDSYTGDNNVKTLCEVRPTLRFYVPAGPQLLINAEGQYIFSLSRNTGYDVDTTRHGFSVGAAATVLVTDNIGIYGGVKYNFFLDSETDGVKNADTGYNRLDFDVGIRVFI